MNHFSYKRKQIWVLMQPYIQDKLQEYFPEDVFCDQNLNYLQQNSDQDVLIDQI